MIIRDFSRQFADAINQKDVETMLSLIQSLNVQIEMRSRIISVLDDDSRNVEVTQIIEATQRIVEVSRTIRGILEERNEKKPRTRKPRHDVGG